MPEDKASERWHAKRYDVDLDPKAHVSGKGLFVTGLVARIQSIKRWTIARAGDRLNIWVDEKLTVVKSTFLNNRSAPQAIDPSMRTLYNIVYAVEALGAEEVFKFFVPTGGSWEVPHYVIRGSIREDTAKRFSNPASKYRLLASSLSCLEQNEVITFDELTLLKTKHGTGWQYRPVEYIPITNHSALLRPGQVLFQPYVMRLKLIDNDIMTSNMVALPSDALDTSEVKFVRASRIEPSTEVLVAKTSKSSSSSADSDDDTTSARISPSLVNLRSIQMQLSPLWCREARLTIA
jgi:hypothetical protein